MEALVLEPRVLAGKYRLDARLRAGAMGAIYRAHHLTLDKDVCIKIMHPELATDPQFAERFQREARAASRFDHPASILVLDYGADADGTLYIAMELVDGRDLFDLIEEAVMAPGGIGAVFTVRRIVDLMSQVLAALAAAHDVGILHRDLKPENIMVASSWEDSVDSTPLDRVKVCDFGIARIDVEDSPAESGRRLTRKGFILGTPEYMSPEQARADAVDARSDIYSAGVILYQLLTGRVPFQDESAIGVALRQINEQPRRPSELLPSVNRELEAIALRAMEKDPARRFASCREMRAALREVTGTLRSTPIPLARADAADTQPMPLVSVSPVVAPGASIAIPARSRALGVVAAAMVLLGVGGFFATRSFSTRSAALSTTAPPLTAPVTTAAPPAAEDAVVPSSPTQSSPVAVANLVAPVVANVAAPTGGLRRQAVSPSKHGASSPPVTHPATAPETPVVTPAPEPEPAPAPAPSPSPEPVPAPVVVPATPAPPQQPVAPAFSLDTAHVDIGSASTVGATAASVDRAIGPIRPRIDACYKAALPHLGANVSGTGTLHVETDDVGAILSARVTGALADDVGPCIVKAALGRKIANVDTGSASADVPLVYRAR